MGLSSKEATPRTELNWLHNASMEIPQPVASSQPRSQQHRQPVPRLKCPRCDSTNTKFCYYNNYSRSQPRHFCKACKRHWTEGGTLRNVPVGGGRKNKRPKTTPTNNNKTTNGDKVIVNNSNPIAQFHHHQQQQEEGAVVGPLMGGDQKSDIFPDEFARQMWMQSQVVQPSEYGLSAAGWLPSHHPVSAQFGSTVPAATAGSYSSMFTSPFSTWAASTPDYASASACPVSSSGVARGALDSNCGYWSGCWDDNDVNVFHLEPDVKPSMADDSHSRRP